MAPQLFTHKALLIDSVLRDFLHTEELDLGFLLDTASTLLSNLGCYHQIFQEKCALILRCFASKLL